MPRTRTGLTVGDWIELTNLVTPEVAATHVALQHIYDKLVAYIEEIEKLLRERDFHEARKQEASKRINEILPEGSRAATLLRQMLKEEYGPDNEKLAEFKIQPFRGRKRRKKEAPPETPEDDKPK
jgi:hypothetical protein